MKMFATIVKLILLYSSMWQTVSSSFDVSSDAEKMYQNEKLMCSEHSAIQSIKKTPIDGPDGKEYRFTLKCLPLKVCNVVLSDVHECEWNHQCTRDDYGDSVYVSGVQSMYIGFQHERYLLLLCCNGTLNITKCAPMKEYTGSAFETELISENMFAHEMFVNHSPFQEKPFVEMHLCDYQSGQNCSSKSSGGGYGMNPATMMFAGAAGAAGFAIIAPMFIPHSGGGGGGGAMPFPD